MIRHFISIVLVFSFYQIKGQGINLNVLDFGVVLDTSIVSTKGIQRAIDSCYTNKGGTVYFPAGFYTTGTLVLKSNVSLHLADGAVIYASKDIRDYRMPLNEATKPVLIYANGAKNISIEGTGEINGRARHVYQELKKVDRFIPEITENARLAGVEMKRYYIKNPNVGLINLANCRNVQLSEFTVRASSFWSVHLVRCENVDINKVSVYSSLEKGVNADGLDINSCRDVRIKYCTIETGDDAIVLKTRYSDPCVNVEVANCTLKSSSTALKIGTESRGDFKDIVFKECRIVDANRGLSIVVLDGAIVDNVKFSDITMNCSRRHFNWWGNADPIWLYVGKRYDDSRLGKISNVTFENIEANGMGTSKIESSIEGRIQDVTFNNLTLNMKIENYADKRADHMFYVHFVDNLIMNKVSFTWTENQTEPLWESAICVEDSKGFQLKEFSGRQGLINASTPALQLINVSGSSLDQIRFAEGTRIGVNISGTKTKNISLGNVDLDQVCEKVVDYQVEDTKDDQ